MIRRAIVAVGLTAVSASAPASADAARVMVVVEPPSKGPWAGVEYDAAAGEANRVELFTVDDKTVRVTDAGAVITPGSGCISLDAHSARCTTAGDGGEGLIGANVRVGDMDDVVNSHGPGLSANGGPGDDWIETVGRIAGTLNGGGGRDVLLGGTNSDTLIDGDISGAADADVMDGREGGAIVSYAGRTARVFVDLGDARPDGEVGERDVLRSVHGAIGGAGADVLRGGSGSDSLKGRAGGDRLYGLGGDDFLSGGRGNDRVSGGAASDGLGGGRGHDLILGGGGQDWLDGGTGRDILRAGRGDDYLDSGASFCGVGLDTVFPSKEVDLIGRDCERASFQMKPPAYSDGKGIELQPNPERPDDNSLVFRLTCPYTELDGYASGVPISGTVTLTERGVVLGRGRVPAGAARRCREAQPDGPGPLPRLRVRAQLARPIVSATRVTVTFQGRNVPSRPWRITLEPRGGLAVSAILVP